MNFKRRFEVRIAEFRFSANHFKISSRLPKFEIRFGRVITLSFCEKKRGAVNGLLKNFLENAKLFMPCALMRPPFPIQFRDGFILL